MGVTGASGFLGMAIASRLGSVRRITRERHGDLLNADLPAVIEGCDMVVNCAGLLHVPGATDAEHQAVNTDLPIALALAAKRAGVKRFVQISSVAALTSQGEAITDATPPSPQTPYGRAKLAADEALAGLANERFSVASIRPPTLYGPGVGAWFALYNRAASKGLPLPLGRIRNLRSFAFVGNIADAVAKCLAGHRSGAWIVSDSEPLSSADLYRSLLALHGYHDRVLKAPARLVRLGLNAFLRNRAHSLLGDAWYDGSSFAEAFEWSAPVNMTDGLALTVASSEDLEREPTKLPND